MGWLARDASASLSTIWPQVCVVCVAAPVGSSIAVVVKEGVLLLCSLIGLDRCCHELNHYLTIMD